MNKKELDREEFYKQYSYDRKHRTLALRQLSPEETEPCLIDEKDLKECNCEQHSDSYTIHSKNCRKKYQRNSNCLRKRYLFLKSRQYFWRLNSPDYHFAGIVEKKIQFKVDATRLKQEILKGKSFTSNMIK